MSWQSNERHSLRDADGTGPRQMVHWEHWSCPDAETYLTGIDYYEHPQTCRLRLRDLYPQLRLDVPESDLPLPRPCLIQSGESADHEHHTVRWGAGETDTFVHGEGYFHITRRSRAAIRTVSWLARVITGS